jgi:GTPase SAR1 family protein
MNLDPAVRTLPYRPAIDIRDNVNYKQVMQDYKLGPNGAIMTALNLYATKFDQVLGILDKRASKVDSVFVDTPGQIEVFTWSASGSIISESIAATHPTCIVFVVDAVRASSPTTFISNVVYACSVMYRMRLPLVLAFNKADACPAMEPLRWLTDYESFQEALDRDTSFAASLSHSLGLMLEEFYSTLRAVAVSAATGQGVDALLGAIEATRPLYAELQAEKKAEMQRKREAAAVNQERVAEDRLREFQAHRADEDDADADA